MRAYVCLAFAFVSSCSLSPPPANHPAPTIDKPVMTGTLARAMVENIPGWMSPVPIDVDAASKLAAVAPGAEVILVIGTWCSDSKREVGRLWQALDVAGPVPFTVALLGVDRDKKAPGLTLEVAYVPLLIVRRGGQEVGRIIESAPNGIEKDLLALLDGSKTGIISGRADLAHAHP